MLLKLKEHELMHTRCAHTGNVALWLQVCIGNSSIFSPSSCLVLSSKQTTRVMRVVAQDINIEYIFHLAHKLGICFGAESPKINHGLRSFFESLPHCFAGNALHITQLRSLTNVKVQRPWPSGVGLHNIASNAVRRRVAGFVFLLLQRRLHTPAPQSVLHPRSMVAGLISSAWLIALIRPHLEWVDVSFQQNASMIDFVNWGFPAEDV